MKTDTDDNKPMRFSDTIMNFAMVVKGEIDDIKELKLIIEKEVDKLNEKGSNVKLIYQKNSPKRLWIEEERESRDGGEY